MDIYEEAWNKLYQVFGEFQNDEALDIMDSVMSAINLEGEEEQCLKK